MRFFLTLEDDLFYKPTFPNIFATISGKTDICHIERMNNCKIKNMGQELGTFDKPSYRDHKDHFYGKLRCNRNGSNNPAIGANEP
jgi:hypothetical protein